MLFSLPEIVSDKKIRVDFDAPDLSSNGGLVLLNGMRTSIAWKIGKLIPIICAPFRGKRCERLMSP